MCLFTPLSLCSVLCACCVCPPVVLSMCVMCICCMCFVCVCLTCPCVSVTCILCACLSVVCVVCACCVSCLSCVMYIVCACVYNQLCVSCVYVMCLLCICVLCMSVCCVSAHVVADCTQWPPLGQQGAPVSSLHLFTSPSHSSSPPPWAVSFACCRKSFPALLRHFSKYSHQQEDLAGKAHGRIGSLLASP